MVVFQRYGIDVDVAETLLIGIGRAEYLKIVAIVSIHAIGRTNPDISCAILIYTSYPTV
jgi:hypothetical protein